MKYFYILIIVVLMILVPTIASADNGVRPTPSSSGCWNYNAPINYYANYYDVPADLIRRICHIESTGRLYAYSPAGAMGLMQVMPFNFRKGENPYNSWDNIKAGTRLLANNYNRYGTWKMAAMAYLGFGGADYWGTTANSYVRKIFW